MCRAVGLAAGAKVVVRSGSGGRAGQVVQFWKGRKLAKRPETRDDGQLHGVLVPVSAAPGGATVQHVAGARGALQFTPSRGRMKRHRCGVFCFSPACHNRTGRSFQLSRWRSVVAWTAAVCCIRGARRARPGLRMVKCRAAGQQS